LNKKLPFLNSGKPGIHVIQGIPGFISDTYKSDVVDEVYYVNNDEVINT
jgi:cysteine synthase